MKIHQILFLLFFICNAFSMEQKKNYALKKINHSVNFPKYIACLQNNHLVIAGTGGIDVIDMNTKTKESISQLYNLKKDPLEITHDIATNKDKSQVAIISTLYLRRFDIKNNIVTLQDQVDIKNKYIAFTYDNNLIIHKPHQTIIYLNGIPTSLQDHTYIKNLEKPITCHPSKNLILYPSSHSQYNSLFVEQCICYPTNFFIDVSKPGHIIGIEYNHDGSLIIINEFNGCFILDSQGNSSPICFNTKQKSKNFIQYPSMALDSHNTLALLSWDNTIQFWDCLTKELLKIIRLNPNPDDKLSPQSTLTKHLAFSYDEIKLYCCLKKNCYELYTPKGKFLWRIFLFLKYYKDPILPQEIVHLIMKNVLDPYYNKL